MADIANLHEVESCASSMYDSWDIFTVLKSGKPIICQLCGESSDSESPFKHAAGDDKHGGKRPWAQYANNREQQCRRVKGRLCLVCQNAWFIKGLPHAPCCNTYMPYHYCSRLMPCFTRISHGTMSRDT